MNYKQYTTCASSAGFLAKHQYINVVIQGLAGGLVALLLMVSADRADCWPIAAELAAIASALAYCHWWLGDRLLCLGGDRVAIGMLVDIEGPLGKTFPGNWDTDYCINLLLADNPIGATQAQVEASTPYGVLVSTQKIATDNGFTNTGYSKPDHASGKPCAVLHAEFEGAGVHDVLLGSQIALGLATLALIFCLALPGPIGQILSWILGILAFLAMLIGAIVGNFDGASPSDVNPDLGDLHTNEKGPDGKGRGADILVVYGTWTFDIVHAGWNELHPIKLCQRIGRWDGDWPADIKDQEVKWGDAIANATSALTADNQKQPENQWTVHPVLDGCDPGPSEPPPRIR